MLRRVLCVAVVVSPLCLFGLMGGCGDTPLPQDICSWLEDGNNCYSRFYEDVGMQCGEPFDGSDPTASPTGYFLSRDDLSICVRDEGGQIVFDPPPDLTTFPLTSVGFKVLDLTSWECGSVAMSEPQTYSVTINPVDQNDAGASGPLTDDITGGTFGVEHPAGTEQINVTCPGGNETHNFNVLVLDKCAHLTSYVPTAILESSPGSPATQSGIAARPGFIRFRIQYPPDDPAAAGNPNVVQYFNCLIPPPPQPCEDGVKNGSETDVDCGGSCNSTCAEGQGCIDNADCTSSNCGLNGGFRQCLP